MADHDPRPLADLVHIGRQPEAERLETETKIAALRRALTEPVA